jgi:membrane protease YdiL (CAAX protease family)
MSAGYVCIDVAECDGCFACGLACGAGAIAAGRLPKAGAATGPKSAAAPKTSKAQPVAKPVQAPIAEKGGRWTLVDAFAIAAVLLAAMVGKEALLDLRAFALVPPSGKTAAFTLVLLLFYAVQLVALRFMSARHGRTVFSAFKSGESAGRVGASAASFGLVIALLLGTRVASTAWGALLRQMGWPPPGESGVLNEMLGKGALGTALVFLTAVVIGPVVEELVFRGVIASAIESRFGLAAAVVSSAMLFAFYHVTPWLYMQMFVLGCALAWLALTRRTLWPAVMLHALYNAVSAAFWLAR